MLDHSGLMCTSNLWSGTKHDNRKVPVTTVGSLGDSLGIERALDYLGVAID